MSGRITIAVFHPVVRDRNLGTNWHVRTFQRFVGPVIRNLAKRMTIPNIVVITPISVGLTATGMGRQAGIMRGASKYGPGVGDTEAVNLLGEVFSPDGGQLGCSLRSKE